jgi:large subunit ribosomal protein L22
MAERASGKMAYEAAHRFARISPRKVRPIAEMIRGKLADDALDVLRYQPQRGARMLEKVLKSALANAEDRRAPNLQHLVVAEVCVDQGPMFRRMRPQARGRAVIIKKRMSHLRITLE